MWDLSLSVGNVELFSKYFPRKLHLRQLQQTKNRGETTLAWINQSQRTF